MLWGSPSTVEDVQGLFLSYLGSKVSSTPFSLEPLSSETATILPYLARLTENNCWTVASQPAVDAASSDDPVFGWGPKGGYVFQKAFVEYFCTSSSLEQLMDRAKRYGHGFVSYYAINAKVSLSPGLRLGTTVRSRLGRVHSSAMSEQKRGTQLPGASSPARK